LVFAFSLLPTEPLLLSAQCQCAARALAFEDAPFRLFSPAPPRSDPFPSSSSGTLTLYLVVLSKIEEILTWEKATDRERDSKFVELGRYLCEVRAGQYWRVDNVRSFDEFLERKFPESRRKAYYLMAIHEQLPRIHKVELQQLGWELSRWVRDRGLKKHF
jgi:hypothetical protein